MKRSARPIDERKSALLCREARRVRADVLSMIHSAGSGSPGSSLSPVDILVWLYRHEMVYRVREPGWRKRDIFILSKGQAAPAYYSIFARIGWLGKRELFTYRKINSRLQTHPQYAALPGIDYSSGSLGQGLSAAVGMALAHRYLGNDVSRIFVLVGDGELQEGQVWEAAMAANKYALEEIVVLVDNNRFQGDGSTEQIMPIEPLVSKWKSFGWEALTIDGHSFISLYEGLRTAEGAHRPKVLICTTIKGKGVSFMENNNEWHVGAALTRPILKRALGELREKAHA